MIKYIKIYLIAAAFIFSGCDRSKSIRRDVRIDVTKPYKIPFIGMDGDKVKVRIKGTFEGKIKIAVAPLGNPLTEGNFATFRDSVDFDQGISNIYTDSTGIVWYIRPVDVKAGSVVVTIEEYHAGFW